MRALLIAVFAVSLAACGQSSAPPLEQTPLATFEDGGCLGALLAHRVAVNEGRAQGDSAALTAAIDAWRRAGADALSADELAQYEASSFAGESNADAEEIEVRAENCIASAPQG